MAENVFVPVRVKRSGNRITIIGKFVCISIGMLVTVNPLFAESGSVPRSCDVLVTRYKFMIENAAIRLYIYAEASVIECVQ